MDTKIIAVANQKGGVGKTTTVINMARSLTDQGKKVLMVDGDPQASLTVSQGIHFPDELEVTLSRIVDDLIDSGKVYQPSDYILTRNGIDYIPSNIGLSTSENRMQNAMRREYIFKSILDPLRPAYDYILIDCPPSLQTLSVNCLAAADSVIIPVTAHYFGLKGVELLLQSIMMAKRTGVNPTLEIEGILITMYDGRTRAARENFSDLQSIYGEHLRIFDSKIPASVRVHEGQRNAMDIYDIDPHGRIAEGYTNATKELIGNE